MKVVKKELVNDDEVCFTSVIMSKHNIKKKIKKSTSALQAVSVLVS